MDALERMTIGSLIQLQKNDVRASAEMLARAFYDDPLFTHFFPYPLERTNKSIAFFQLLVRYYILYGETDATSPAFEGVAIWFPFNKTDMSAWRSMFWLLGSQDDQDKMKKLT
jgi:hypothetical protein